MGKQWKKIICLVLTVALIGTNGIGDIPKSMAQTVADTEVSTDGGTYTIGSNADGELEITGFSGKVGKLDLRKVAEQSGITVVSIHAGAFKGNQNISEVIFPDTIQSIGESAFEDCALLSKCDLPDGLTNIGERAFAGCRSLTSVTIPGSVTSIGKDAFDETLWLKSRMETEDYVIINKILIMHGKIASGDITIPEGVTSIGSGAFDIVPLVIYDGESTDYSSWGANVVQKSDGTVLYSR